MEVLIVEIRIGTNFDLASTIASKTTANLYQVQGLRASDSSTDEGLLRKATIRLVILTLKDSWAHLPESCHASSLQSLMLDSSATEPRDDLRFYAYYLPRHRTCRFQIGLGTSGISPWLRLDGPSDFPSAVCDHH
jgi:hypothetical protein